MKHVLRNLLLVAGLVLASCSHRPVSASGIPIDDLEAYAAGPIFADPTLSASLEIGQIRAQRTRGDLLQITVPFHNVSGERLEVLCKVIFKDAAGVALPGDLTGYQYQGLPVGLTHKHFTSLKTQASRYEVHIRRFKP